MERKQEQKLPIHQISSGTQSPLHVGAFSNQIPLPPLLPPPPNPPLQPNPPLESSNGMALQIPVVPTFPSLPSQTRCTACGLGFTEKDQLVAHLKLHLPGFPSNHLGGGGPPFVCAICSLSFPKAEDLGAHMITHSPENGLVGLHPASPGSLSPSPDSCKENGSPFGNRFKGGLQVQKVTKAGPGEKPFVCEKCGKAFSQKGNLSTHIRDTHTNPSGVACPVCGKKLKNKNSLKVHIRTHSDTLPFICNADDCGRRFNQKCSLVIHQRIHTGEKPYTCSCGKKFRSSSNCAAHKRSHTGEGCIPCNVCGKKFGSRSRYISHSRTHTGEKPFQCQICDKRFTEKSSRSKHMRIHSREKPFACHFCEKKFRLKRGLNSHLRTHTNDMPFACSSCGRTYRHKVSLTKHAAKCDEKSIDHSREREREQNLGSSPGNGNPASPISPSESPASSIPSLPPLPISELNLTSGIGSMPQTQIGTLPSRVPTGLSLPNRSPIGHLGGLPSTASSSTTQGRISMNPLLPSQPMGSNGIPGSVSCLDCGLTFKSSVMLQNHKRTVHDVGAMLNPALAPYPQGLPLPRFGVPDHDPYSPSYTNDISHVSNGGVKRKLDAVLTQPSDQHVLRLGGSLSSLPPSSPSGSLAPLSSHKGPFEPSLKHQRTDLHRIPPPLMPPSDHVLMPSRHLPLSMTHNLNHISPLDQDLDQDPDETEELEPDEQEIPEPEDQDDNSPVDGPEADLNQSIGVS